MKPRAYFFIRLNKPEFCYKYFLLHNSDFILAKRYRDELYCYVAGLDSWRYVDRWDRGYKQIESQCGIKEARKISQEELDKMIKHHSLVEKLSR